MVTFLTEVHDPSHEENERHASQRHNDLLECRRLRPEEAQAAGGEVLAFDPGELPLTRQGSAVVGGQELRTFVGVARPIAPFPAPLLPKQVMHRLEQVGFFWRLAHELRWPGMARCFRGSSSDVVRDSPTKE